MFFFFEFKQKFVEEAKHDGLGWQHTDGVTFGVQVDSIEASCTLMVLLFERQSSAILEDTRIV